MMVAILFHPLPWTGVVIATLVVAALAWWQLRRRYVGRWLGTYMLQARKRRAPSPQAPIHLLLCIADHFEPAWGGAPALTARARVESWVNRYPELFARFRDADGRPPRHTFFYPLEEYDSTHLDALAGLCRAGFGEVEVQLHHDGDNSANLRRILLEYRQLLAERHGLLARHRQSGAVSYGFVHGNWALDNSRPDGRWCGVNDELNVLRDTGCYADFTLPSAPSPTQTRKINSIYYATDDPVAPRSHDGGADVGAGPRPPDGLMLIQGPLLLDWRSRKWGMMPRIENGCIQRGQPPTARRLELWLTARVQVPARPDWFFVKLHTHGAPETNQQVLLGDAMVHFHEALALRAARDSYFSFHYVTAREMYNLARAAEAGWQGTVEEARGFELRPL